MGRTASRPRRAGPRRLSPVPTTTFRPFHAPYAGGFIGARSRIKSTVHGLRRSTQRLGSPLPPLPRGLLTTLQASLHAADRPVARPPLRTLPRASTPDSHPTPAGALPRTLASPRTGLTPAGCRELLARLHRRTPSMTAPELLDARGSKTGLVRELVVRRRSSKAHMVNLNALMIRVRTS